MKKLMILGASILQLPAIEQATSMGIQVIAIDMNPQAIGFKVDGVIKEIVSTVNTSAITELAIRHKIDGIITLASDIPMLTIAKVSKELGLNGITAETALRATNKGAMRQALKENCIPIPSYYKVDDEKDFEEAILDIRGRGYECIVKPSDNSGSRGIILLSDYSQSALKKAFEYSRKHSNNGSILVEEYMEGPEVSVETLVINGVCHVIQITDKITTGAPYFVEMGHSQPSMLNQVMKNKISKIAISANKAIGIESGPAHIEIIVTKDGPKIVEIGARLGGDNITTHLVPYSTGVNMVEHTINTALGNEKPPKIKHNKGSAIRYLQANKGIITKIDGIDEANLVEGVTQISVVHGIGKNSNTIKSSVDRVGFVISKGETAYEAINSCEKAVNLIKITIQKEGE